ncbi:MAG TPA: hypothetical protein PK629_07375 [Oscillospiraceae bacterium]|nr:hypothetical protein [Oscillospiraceae bacterium]HPF55896.1 hypothetical protein [Clostridiales bacterium]HPK35021.1 hypothetical protein [Oscillospiraceae bacterium]HPR76270.1 hypothetical protein [Oscillospiraceae bacterium]
MKKNTVTFAVCVIFGAVMTAVNAFAAKGTAEVITRDLLGYAYAILILAALIWLHVTGKKQFTETEPGRFIMTSWEYFFFGAAVLVISAVSFINIYPEYNQYLYRLDEVTQGPFLMTRMAFSIIGLVVGGLLLAAGSVKNSVFKNLSTTFAAIWGFAYLVSECTFFIPLPDISLYLPRLGTAVFTTLAFCYITMAGKVGLQRNAAGLRTCSGMMVIFSISDMAFWLIYHHNVYRGMLLSSFLFAAFFGGYFIWLSLILDRKFQIPAEVTDLEI